MIKKMEDLGPEILGLKAEGKVTREDYEQTVIPLLNEARSSGKKISLLYHFGPDFADFTPHAAWTDFKVGFKYLNLFKKIAVVSDVEWVRNAAQAVGSLLTCPIRIFSIEDLNQAIVWLSSLKDDSKLKFDFKDDGVLLIEPQEPLKREDFELLSSLVDPWIEKHGKLKGIVIHMKDFPGWENFGGFIQHLDFVNAHHRQVRRVAVAVDSRLPELVSKISEHFVDAKIERFPYGEVERAIAWASH